jgi:hypothetical protein
MTPTAKWRERVIKMRASGVVTEADLRDADDPQRCAVGEAVAFLRELGVETSFGALTNSTPRPLGIWGNAVVGGIFPVALRYGDFLGAERCLDRRSGPDQAGAPYFSTLDAVKAKIAALPVDA